MILAYESLQFEYCSLLSLEKLGDRAIFLLSSEELLSEVIVTFVNVIVLRLRYLLNLG